LLFDLKPDLKLNGGINQNGANQNIDRQQLTEFGDVRTPSIADLFVAILSEKPGDGPGTQAGQPLGNYEGAAR
jgi:hypothetical protein